MAKDIFVYIAERRVTGTAPGTPGGGDAGAGGLIPGDFSAHQETQRQLVANDECMQWNVWFAAQISHVDTSAAAGHQGAQDLCPDAVQHGQIIVQVEILIVFLAGGVRRRGDHEMNAGIWQLAQFFATVGKNMIACGVRQRISGILSTVFGGAWAYITRCCKTRWRRGFTRPLVPKAELRMPLRGQFSSLPAYLHCNRNCAPGQEVQLGWEFKQAGLSSRMRVTSKKSSEVE